MKNLDDIIIPPWVKIIAFSLLVLGLISAIYAYGQQQFSQGEQSEKAQCLSRANTELLDANTKITETEEKYRAQEKRHTEAMAAKDAQHQKDLENVKNTKNSVIADLRSNNLKLRIPVTGTGQTCGDHTAETGTGTGINNGETRAELSQEASEFLIGLTSECDEVAIQLTAAQAIIIEDRAISP